MKKLRSKQDIVKLITNDGFLPFFENKIKDFSISERIDRRYWFPDDGDGVWEWKGPIIQTGNIAYGKFFRKKALFVSMEFFPDFLNYRRSRYALTSNEAELLEILQEEGSLLSTEWKELSGYEVQKKRRNLFTGSEEAQESEFFFESVRRESFDASVTALQMACYVVTEDFEYRVDRNGRRYGWGLARYTTPEMLFGGEALEVNRDPQESFDYLCSYLKKLLPLATEKEILSILN